MKKTLALITFCTGIVLIGYSLYRFSGYDIFLYIPLMFVAMLAAVHLIGLFIWLLEYIGKPKK